MPRYWVIAPFSVKNQDVFNQVWQFDIANNRISIGWHELGDPTSLTREALIDRVAKSFPESPLATRSLYANMIWAFFHEIKPGDIILARRGRKVLAAVGDVARSGYHSPGENPTLNAFPHIHPNFLEVDWRSTPQ